MVFENVRKLLACRSPVLGCLIYKCESCGHVWRIPKLRILRFEKFFEIKKGHPFVWECHDCHEGAVIPGTYKNIHGEIVKFAPKSLDPDTEVMRF